MTFVSVHVHDKSLLAGAGQGTYTEELVPDVGPIYNLNGTAALGVLGNVNLSGSIHATGLIVTGKASGTLTLTNADGSVTIRLTGPAQKGFSPLPEKFRFTIVDATGAYKGLKVSGSIHLKLVPGMGITNPVGAVLGGGFNLTIVPTGN
jgi:hypothetical protein